MTAYPEIGLYIHGAWRKTADTLPILNPADETVLGQCPVATIADLDDALDSAARGFALWSRTSPHERAAVLIRAFVLDA